MRDITQTAVEDTRSMLGNVDWSVTDSLTVEQSFNKINEKVTN